MRTVNAELVRRTLAHIEANLGQWDQGRFTSCCDTQHCFAGWAYILGTGDTWEYDLPDGEHRRRILTAAELLGFDDNQADQVFYFMVVWEPQPDGRATRRRPTFAELVARVEAATGVSYTSIHNREEALV